MGSEDSKLAIEALNLTKTYRGKKGGIKALDNVSLNLEWGQFVALLGENGAGKTTLIKILCTLLLPDSGTAKVAGYDVVREPSAVRSRIGWLHGETGGRALYWRLNAWDNLKFYAHLHNVASEEAAGRIPALIEYFGLSEYARKLVKDYSTGMKARLMLARTLLPNPDILLLDEPTAGLDASVAYEVRSLLMMINRELGKPILFTSHNMFEVERMCSRIVLLHKGRLVVEGPPPKICGELARSDYIEIKFRARESVLNLISSNDVVSEVLKAERQGDSWTLLLKVKDMRRAFSELPGYLLGNGINLTSIKMAEPSLEEAFIRLTGS